MSTVHQTRKQSPRELIANRMLAKGIALRHAGSGWKALSAQLSALAPRRIGRIGVGVSCYPEAGGSEGAWGWFAPQLSQIVLDGRLLPCEPLQLNPHSDPDHFKALTELWGVFSHECGHAAHTQIIDTEGHPDAVRQLVTALEEIRMEAMVARERPQDVPWIRASAKRLHREGAASSLRMLAALGGNGLAVVNAALITTGRAHAGTLQAQDVAEIEQLLQTILDPDVYREMNAIFAEATQVEDAEQEKLIGLAERLAELFPEDSSQQLVIRIQSGGEDTEEDSQGDDPADAEMIGELADAIEGALDEAAEQGTQEVADKDGHKQLKGLADQLKAREAIESAQKKISASRPGSPTGSQPQHGERLPTADERRQRVILSRHLRRVRWRDRAQVRHNSQLPPGRLSGRELLRQRADHARGLPSASTPWRQRHTRAVEIPDLTCSILVDTSGSMSGTEEILSSAMWVLANAISDNGGKVTGYAFGNGVKEVLSGDKGTLSGHAPPRHVTKFSSGGGTAGISTALEMAEEELGWERGERGPRLLVICSDGAWGDVDESADALSRVQAAGVKTILCGIKHSATDYGMPELYSEQIVVASGHELADQVGNAAVRALAAY